MTIGTDYAYPQTTIRCLKCGGIIYTQEGVRRMAYQKLADGRAACKPCFRKMEKSGEIQATPAPPPEPQLTSPPAAQSPVPAPEPSPVVAAAPSPPFPAPPPVPAYAPPPKADAPPACEWCGESPPNTLRVEGGDLRQCAPCLLKAVAQGDDPRRGGMPDDAPLRMDGAFVRELLRLAAGAPTAAPLTTAMPTPQPSPAPDYAAALERAMSPPPLATTPAPAAVNGAAPPSAPAPTPAPLMPATHLANPGDGYCKMCSRAVNGDHHYCPPCYAKLPYCGCGRGKKLGYNSITGRHHEVCYACRQDAARDGYYGDARYG